ncbi:unnamed protein product, partial [Amoebophrya sp. A25]|eukprot:GSA25T00017917001.1
MLSASSTSCHLARRQKADVIKGRANFIGRRLGARKKRPLPAGDKVSGRPVTDKKPKLGPSSSKSSGSRGGDREDVNKVLLQHDAAVRVDQPVASASKTVILAFNIEDGTLRISEKEANFIKGEKVYARYDLQCSDAGDKKKNPSLKRDYSGLLCKSELWT